MTVWHMTALCSNFCCAIAWYSFSWPQGLVGGLWFECSRAFGCDCVFSPQTHLMFYDFYDIHFMIGYFLTLSYYCCNIVVGIITEILSPGSKESGQESCS